MSLIINSVTKSYDKQQALADVSFTLNKGEIVGFLGPNGAGKSTLMKIITCYLQQDSGKVQGAVGPRSYWRVILCVYHWCCWCCDTYING